MTGSYGGGGGGAGFGGAVFVVAGGSLTVVDGTSFSGNTVTAGQGAGGGGNGSTDGNDLFLMRGVTTNFNIGSGQTLTFAPIIGNEDGTANAGVTIDKTGAGTLILSGNNSLVGSTTVDAGTLVVNGTINDVTVNNLGILMGTGTVGATTVNAGGVINPGAAGSQLTINGAFNQQSGSNCSIEVSSTACDKIVVNGAATIQSNTVLQVIYVPGTFHAGQSFAVLTASGGITGQYSAMVSGLPGGGLAFGLDYSHPGEIDLDVVSIAPNFAGGSLTANQNAAALALDASGGGATGDYATVISSFGSLSSGQLPGALNQIDGDIYASLAGLELQTTTAWLNLLNNRLAGALRPNFQGGSTPVATAETVDVRVVLVSYQDSDRTVRQVPQIIFSQRGASRWTGWTQGYGLGGGLGSNGNAGGLGYGVGGTLFGVDRWLSENLMVGTFGGYAGSLVNERTVSDSARVNSYQAGAYQLLRQNQFYLSNMDAYSNSDYTSTRNIIVPGISRTATGTSSGNQFAHYSEVGATLGNGRTRWQPFSGIQYIYLDQNGYTETGAGSLNLTTNNQYVNSVRGSIGARVYQEVRWGNVTMIPTLTGRYQHEYGDGTRLLTSSFAGAPTTAFTVTGNSLGRDFGWFTLGSTAVLGPRTSLYAGYDLQIANNYAAHMGSGMFQYTW